LPTGLETTGYGNNPSTGNDDFFIVRLGVIFFSLSTNTIEPFLLAPIVGVLLVMLIKVLNVASSSSSVN